MAIMIDDDFDDDDDDDGDEKGWPNLPSGVLKFLTIGRELLSSPCAPPTSMRTQTRLDADATLRDPPVDGRPVEHKRPLSIRKHGARPYQSERETIQRITAVINAW